MWVAVSRAARRSPLAIAVVVAAACARSTPDDARRGWSLVAGGEAVVEAPVSLREAAEAWCARLSALGPVRFRVGRHASAPRVVVAVTTEVRRPLPASASIPVGFGAGRFQVADRVFDGSADAAVFACADPERPELPLFGVVGNDAGPLAALLPSLLLPESPSVRVFRNGELDAAWRLDDSGRPRPSTEDRIATVVDASDLARLRTEDSRDEKLELADLTGPVGPAGLVLEGTRPPDRAVLEALSSAQAGFERLTGISHGRLHEDPFGRSEARRGGSSAARGEVHGLRIGCVGYESLEAKWRATRDASGVFANPVVGRLHLVAGPDALGDAAREYARLAARARLGGPPERWMEEGLATLSAIAMDGRGFDRSSLGARLNRAAAAVRVEDLRDERRRVRLSPFRTRATAAALVAELRDSLGVERFVRVYRGEESPPNDADLQAMLDRALAEWEVESRPRRPAPLAGFRQGIHLVAGPDEPAAGYGSRAVGASLDRVAAAGAGWVAIGARAPLRRPWGESLFDFDPTEGKADPDAAIVSAAREARARGLRVAIGPVFGGVRYGVWATDLPPRSREETDWLRERVFDAAVHHAILAEAAGADLLVVGDGVRAMTTAMEPEAWREARAGDWRRTIASCRALFTGAIAYAAGDLEEAEGLRFADALDFLAVPPLDARRRGQGRVDPKSLLSKIASTARSQRTLALVFRAGADPGGFASDADARAFLDRAAAHPEIAGLFWWAWPTDLSRPRRGGGGSVARIEAMLGAARADGAGAGPADAVGRADAGPSAGRRDG